MDAQPSFIGWFWYRGNYHPIHTVTKIYIKRSRLIEENAFENVMRNLLIILFRTWYDKNYMNLRNKQCSGPACSKATW